MPTGNQLFGSVLGKKLAEKRKKDKIEKDKKKIDSVTGAGKVLMSNEERAKRLAKSDRIKREKKGKPFSGNAAANKLLGKDGKRKTTDKQRKKFKSLFFVK